MNKKIVISLVIATLAMAPVAVFGSTFASWAVTDNASPLTFKIGSHGDLKTIKYYTTYADSTWGGLQQELVIDGDSLESTPTFSIEGYTLKGWRTSVPGSSAYTTTYTVAELASLNVTADLTLWPIIESNDKYIKDSYGSFFKENTDFEYNGDSMPGGLQLGYRYYGIDGIPNPLATYNTNRTINTDSGIYKLVQDGENILMFRKIGFHPNDTWKTDWNGMPSFGVHSWNGLNDVNVHLGNTLDENGNLYGYIPAQNYEFQFVRYGHNETAPGSGANYSANLCFAKNWEWSGDANSHYDKASIVLKMNNDAGYSWNSSNAKWYAS